TVGSVWTSFTDPFVHNKRSHHILGVKPTSYGHDSRSDVFQMGFNVTGLPELVIHRMLHVFIPMDVTSLEMVFVHITQGAHLQPEFVTSRGIIVEHPWRILGCRFWSGMAKSTQKAQIMRHQKGTVMHRIISSPQVTHRS